MIGCDCETCTSTDPRDSRNRASVLIEYGQTRVLVDTPPELRIAAVANGIKRIDAVVFTHGHADHITGLDDLRRFNAVKQGPLDLFATERTHQTLRTVFAYAFREPDPESRLFRPHLVPRTIDGPFDIAGQTWRPIPMLHGEMPVLGFRVGPLAYCTDVNEIPAESWPLLENLDLLVLDGLQWKKHTTHFNIGEAIEVAQRLKPKRTLLTHIAHGVLHARDEHLLPDGIELAYDGQQVEI